MKMPELQREPPEWYETFLRPRLMTNSHYAEMVDAIRRIEDAAFNCGHLQAQMEANLVWRESVS